MYIYTKMCWVIIAKRVSKAHIINSYRLNSCMLTRTMINHRKQRFTGIPYPVSLFIYIRCMGLKWATYGRTCWNK